MKLFILMFLLLFSSFSFAGTFEQGYTNGFQLSLGGKAYKIDGSRDALTGLELTFGPQYTFSSKISGKTALDLSYSRVEYDHAVNNVHVAESSINEYTYGILQTFFYNGILGSAQFRPFVSLGFGNSLKEDKYDDIFGSSEKFSKNYLYFKYGAGFQLLSMSGVGGEFKVSQQRNKDYHGNLASLSFIYTF